MSQAIPNFCQGVLCLTGLCKNCKVALRRDFRELNSGFRHSGMIDSSLLIWVCHLLHQLVTPPIVILLSRAGRGLTCGMAYSSVTSTCGFPWEMHYGKMGAPCKLLSWFESSAQTDYVLRFSFLSYHFFFSNPNRQALHVCPCHWPRWSYNSPCTAVVQHSPSFSQPLWRNAFPDW